MEVNAPCFSRAASRLSVTSASMPLTMTLRHFRHLLLNVSPIGRGISFLPHLIRPLRDAAYPLLVASQAIPIVVLAPIFVLAFDYGIKLDRRFYEEDFGAFHFSVGLF